MLRELYIQSNIPIIVLAISIICILVIGFLEVKKLNTRIDHLNTEVENLRSTKSGSTTVLSVEEEKEKEIMDDETDSVEEDDSIVEDDSVVEEKKESFKNKKEDEREVSLEEAIMGHPMMGGEEVIIGIGGPPGMPGGMPPGMFPFPGMGGILGGMVFEESIPQQEMEQERKNEIVELEEDDDSDNESEKKETIVEIDDGESSVDDGSSDESSEESESGSDNEDIEEVISNKEKIATNEMSIKQLKEMCISLDLSMSGNKSQLVKRINENINKV